MQATLCLPRPGDLGLVPLRTAEDYFFLHCSATGIFYFMLRIMTGKHGGFSRTLYHNETIARGRPLCSEVA